MTLHRPRLRFLPGSPVWVVDRRERSTRETCPRCQGQGWRTMEKSGHRYSCGCDCGQVRVSLSGYEVPVLATVDAVILGSEDDGSITREYRVHVPHPPYGDRVVGLGAWGMFDTEEACWADIRARGYTLEQVEARERRRDHEQG